MNIAEMFVAAGYKVDEASIKRYDRALEESKKKTEDITKSSEALFKRMQDLEESRKREEAQVKEFIRLYDKLIEKKDQRSAEEKKSDTAKAIDAVSLAPIKIASEKDQQAKAEQEWKNTVVAVEAGLSLLQNAFGYVRGKVSEFLGELSAAGGRAGAVMDLSERTGIATDALQELGFVAEQNGADMTSLATGLKSITNKADAAAAGGKSAAKAFRDVGINAKDLKSGKLSLDDALGKIADKFASMPDGAKKSALAMDLLGGSGGRLIPMLNKGSAGIVAMREEARRLGIVLSKDALSGLDTLDDSTAKLKTTFTALRTQALAAVVPMVQKLVDKAQAWMAENREQFVAALTVAFRALATALSLAADATGVVVSVFSFLAENSEIVRFAVVALTAAMIAYGAWSIWTSKVSTAAAIKAAKMWLLAAWPFALIGLAVAALILYWDEIVDAVSAAASAVGGFFVDVKDAVLEFLLDAGGVIKEWISSAIDFFLQFKDVLLLMWTALKEVVPRVLEAVWGKVKSFFSRFVSGASSTFRVLKDALIWPFKTAWEWIRKKLDDASAWIQGWINKLPSWVRNRMGIDFSTAGADTRAGGNAPITATSPAPMPVPSVLVPSSAQQSTRSTTIQNNIPINITSTDPAASGKAVRGELESFWNQKMREVVS